VSKQEEKKEIIESVRKKNDSKELYEIALNTQKGHSQSKMRK